MDTPPPHDQFREIARIHQQPIYFPNALGMERLKWVWGIIAAIVGAALWLSALQWSVKDNRKDVDRNRAAVEQLWEKVFGYKMPP